jgi:microcompartment protein CcmL/EutN
VSRQYDVIGVQEYSSIALGVEALDAMVKAAPVEVITTRLVEPGRLVILITGDVASVEASLAAGKIGRLAELVDELFIQNLDPQVIPALRGENRAGEWDALGIIESLSVAAGIEAADAAAKASAVRVVDIRLSGGMGGKSTVKLMGRIHEVEAGMAAGVRLVSDKGLLCREVVLANPHPDIRQHVLDLPHEGMGVWK